MSLLILLTPAVPYQGEEVSIMPKYLLPSIFHLWSLMPRSSLYDFQSLDLVATLVSDSISSELVEFDKYGILTQDQLSIVFTAILRLLEVPVSYVGSPYVHSAETVSLKSDRDKKVRCARPIANIIVYSLSAESGLEKDGILDRLESLIHAVETFCHPSNYGSWTRNIMQTIALMVEIFLLRWNVQLTGESIIPKERHLTNKVKDRFVQILRNATFLGIHAKSSTVVSSALEALQGLAYLSPDLIIPRLLKEVYPSLQGLVETHRTMSSLKALTVLARKISQEPKYALHITTLLGLAVPGIDANDLSKTLNSLSFIQAVALNVPFYDISENIGSGLAMEYISSSIAYLEENGELPVIPDEIVPDIVKSSTIAFDEFIILLLDRIFSMLENLPDNSSNSNSSKSRDSPEAHVVNALPPAITAILGAVSPNLFNRIVNHVVDFVSNNVIHNATDPIAHICGCLVKVNAKVAFPKLFQMLYYKIKEEIEENGAGSIRSSEILPRDRALIWYLSCLNMALAHSFAEALPFKKEIVEITLFLRANCKGSIVYHVSNTIHHTLMTLTTTIANDYSLVGDNAQVGLDNWGEKIDPNKLEVKWHIPNREEIELAVELYSKHCEISINSIKEIVNDSNAKSFSITEISDIISNNITYIRTSTSGISLLFDSKYSHKSHPIIADSVGDSEYEESESQEMESEDSEYSTDDEDELLQDNLIASDGDLDIEGELIDLKKYREYPVNYFFDNKTKFDDTLYHKIHELRINIGKFLHEIHLYLSKNRDNDIASFKALLFATKVWFSDVGIERSAKTIDSLCALYSYETKHFRIPGLRKEYPRPVLARRAYLYHYERLAHNIGPRKMTELEKTLLFDSVKSCLSIYPDIRRNGQSSFESAIRILVGSRSHVYPYVLKELNIALHSQEYNKAESAIRLLNMRMMQSSIKKDFRHIISFVNYIKQAMQADYPTLNAVATSLYNYFATNIRLPLDVISINMKVIEELKPNDDETSRFNGLSISKKIEMLKSKKSDKRLHAEKELTNLIDYLAKDNEDKKELHWKLIAVNSGLFTAICSSPQMPIDPRVLVQLGNGALSPHPGIKAICMHGLFMISSKLFNLANSGYDYRRFLLDCDEDNILSDNGMIVDSSAANFQETFSKELESFNNPTYYLDKGNANYGWLVWPKKFEADKADYKDNLKFSVEDEKAVRGFGSMMTGEWISGVITRHLEEPRVEDDYFDVTNAIFFKIVLRLVGIGFTPITIDEFLSLVEQVYDPKDKNSHRCVAEMCSAIIDSLKFTEGKETVDKKVKLLVKIFSDILENNIAHDNIEYWRSFVWWSSIYIDFRRAWQVEKLINEIRLTTDHSSIGVKDSSRLSLLRKSIGSTGWYYKHDVDDIIDNLWGNITHPLQGVREEVAKTLAVIYSSRYHESFGNVKQFIAENYESGPVGLLCYKMKDSLSIRIEQAFNKLEDWRLERTIDGRGTSQYVLASKTLSLFLETLFKKSYAVSLIPLFPKTIIPALLNFLNVRDEEEVMLSAVSLFKLLGNIPCPMQYIQLMVDMIVDIGMKATTWHQRISILSYVQAFFFRQLFKMNKNHRNVLINSVTDMLQDVQLEVRELAAETLAGLVRCSPVAEQEELISKLQDQCTTLLHETRNWTTIKRTPASLVASPIPSRPGTPVSRTGVPLNEYQFSMVKRHSAVLGLGALVKAFPYQSPPPHWIPQVMQVLAVKAANDPGMVGKSVKATLGDFKKTRQDTWHIDSKVFTSEQLEDLEGVLWKNYFI